jgi:hypothetical protein
MTTRLLEAHEAQRRNVDLEGRALLDRIRREDPTLGDYMKGRIAEGWAELWLGDQIPETVEHSRKHSKRLMETTAHFFRAAPETLKDLGLDRPAPLALLLSAIVLHDIGHTSIKADLSANGKRIPFSLDGSPRRCGRYTTCSLSGGFRGRRRPCSPKGILWSPCCAA